MNETTEILKLLARLDERTHMTQKTLVELREDLRSSYVRKESFRPVRALVYGMTALMLASVLTAILTSTSPPS